VLARTPGISTPFALSTVWVARLGTSSVSIFVHGIFGRLPFPVDARGLRPVYENIAGKVEVGFPPRTLWATPTDRSRTPSARQSIAASRERSGTWPPGNLAAAARSLRRTASVMIGHRRSPLTNRTGAIELVALRVG